MSYVVTLEDFTPGARHDDPPTPWTEVQIKESAVRGGPFVLIDTQPLDPLDTDPANPTSRDFTTNDATLPAGWYQVVFRDAAGNEQPAAPVRFPAGPGYTSIDDLRDALAPTGDTTAATAAALTDGELIDVIAEAGREVDARLGGRYGVPFDLDDVPPLVAQLTRDIAAYLATLTHRRYQPVAPEHPVALRYARAQRILADLQAGTAELDTAVSDDTATGTGAVVNPYEGKLWDLDDLGIGPASAYDLRNQ